MTEEIIETAESTTMVSGNSDASVTTATIQPETASTEHMIPKSRFDEVNNKLRDLLEKQESAEKEAAKRKEAELLEQNEFQRLYEEEKKRSAEALKKVSQIERQSLARDVANEAGIPQMWNRLQGATKEELEADVKSLLKILPKPQAPNLDSGKRGSGANVDVDALRDQAIRLGVNPDTYIKTYTGN